MAVCDDCFEEFIHPLVHESQDKNEKFHRVESFYGTFLRQFSLPDNIDANAIRCESQDGVLTVHIPKKTVEKPKQIEVKVQ